jgi:type II secretory pathway predicted ATPase ExeA
MLDMHDHYDPNREPFTKDLTLDMLHHHHGHDEAAARITWCIREGAIAVITGEAGTGKTAAAPSSSSTKPTSWTPASSRPCA